MAMGWLAVIFLVLTGHLVLGLLLSFVIMMVEDM